MAKTHRGICGPESRALQRVTCLAKLDEKKFNKILLSFNQDTHLIDKFPTIFCIWEVTSCMPYLTAEIRNQTPQAITVIDTLLKYIGNFIAGKICSVFETHAPEQWEAMQRAYRRVQIILAAQLLECPSLDFGGSVFAVTVKEGGSQLIHINWHDCHAIWAFVFAIGDWEGGEFCAPELGIKIPI
ncbi:hypothetical protein BD769DRAFT_1390944 [Suillus cothurnatus]|nr:hypothetical protein BD769DRAFT_1390944 [Suillus cothurnatus]